MARRMSRRSRKSRSRRTRRRRGGNAVAKALPVLTLLGLNTMMGKRKEVVKKVVNVERKVKKEEERNNVNK